MTMTQTTPRSHADPLPPSAIYVPPGWPERVYPPGTARWEETAIEFLLDCCPADYRTYPVLRRHPIVLARFAAEFVESQLRVGRESLSEMRRSLRRHVGPEIVRSAAELCQEQDAALIRVRRAVALIEESLRGKVFIRPL